MPDKPMFVKIVGPGRFQIQPYSRAGWLAMLGWILLELGVFALLLLPAVEENWWVVLILSLTLTGAFVIFCLRHAVPVEQVRKP